MPITQKMNMMKKITTLLTAGLFSVLSASAFACPKGTTLTGGTGPNHKGGSCVAVNGVAQKAKASEVKAETAKMKDKTTTTNKTATVKSKETVQNAKTATAAKVKTETNTKAKATNQVKVKSDTKNQVSKDVKNKDVKAVSNNTLKS